MICKSGDGKKIQRLTAEKATLDLNQPIGPATSRVPRVSRSCTPTSKATSGSATTAARPWSSADDMNVGPMTYLDFDDATQQITSESHVDIVDPDQTTIGDGLVIQLRKPDPEARPSIAPRRDSAAWSSRS